jgi:hypothetical protein
MGCVYGISSYLSHHTWYLAYLDDPEYPQFPSDAYPVLFDVYHTLIEDP